MLQKSGKGELGIISDSDVASTQECVETFQVVINQCQISSVYGMAISAFYIVNVEICLLKALKERCSLLDVYFERWLYIISKNVAY